MVVKILYVVSVFDSLGFSMVLPVLKSYMMQVGGTQFSIGLLDSLVAFISLLWNPIMGSLSDSRGRKPMLLLSLLVCLISNLVLVASNSFMMVIFARTLAALGSQIAGTLKAILSDNVPSSEEQNRIMGKMQVNSGVCFIVGSLFSGFLTDLDNGFKYLFMLVSLLFAINIGLVSLIPQESKKTKNKSDKSEKIQITKEISKAVINLKEISWQKYWDILMSRLCVDMSFGVFFSVFIALLITDFGLKGSAIGYIFAFMSISGIIMNLSLIKIKKKFYENDNLGFKRLLHSMVLLTITYIGASVSSNIYVLVWWLLPLIAARVLLDSTLNEVVLLRVDGEAKGRVIGATDSMSSLAGLIAPTLSGVVAYNFGNVVGMLCAAAPTTIAVLILSSQRNKFVKNVKSS